MISTDKSVFKRRIIFCLITLFAAYSLNGFLLSPITFAVSGDIIYADTVIPTLLGIIGELIELVAIAICYAVMISLLYDAGKLHIKPLFWLFLGSTLYKYTANTVISWIMGGSIPSLWIWDVVNILYYTVLELLQLYIVYMASVSVITRYTDKRAIIDKVQKKTGENSISCCPEPFPFNKLYDKENCLLRSAYFCALVTFIAKLSGTLLNDVWSMIVYGLPSVPVTWLLMILNYLSKVIFGAIAYFIIIAMLSRLLNKERVK